MPAEAAAGGAFTYNARVRFHQADPAGVLFFGRVFELVSDAYEELIAAAGLSFDDPASLGAVTTPIVRVETDYRQPIRVGELVQLQLVLDRLGESSLSYRYRIVDERGTARVEGRVVHAFVALPSFAKVAMPPLARDAFRRLARRYGMPVAS